MGILLCLPSLVGVVAIVVGLITLRNLSKKKRLRYDGPFLCNMCYPDYTEIGKIAPALTVVVDQYGMYLICYGGYGHQGSLYQMQTKPWPDPWEGLSDEEIEGSGDEGWKNFCLWKNKATIDQKTFFQWLGSIEACNYLVEDLQSGGYKQKDDGNVWMYIFHRAGVIIRDYEANVASEG